MRNRILAAVVLTLLACPVLVAQEFSEVEFEKATTTILCDCGCHPQSVDQCACGRAAEMRDDIAALIREGMTGDEIVAQYVAEHGEQIRISPTATGFNLVAWLGPGLGLLLTSLAVGTVLFRWKRSHAPDDSGEDTPSDTPATETEIKYEKRLRDALENLE